MKKIVKILLWIVGVVVVLLLLVSLLAGPVAKGYVNSHGEDLTGRKVHVSHVGVNMFTGHVALRGLDVYEEDGTTSFAGFDTLDVRARLLRLIGKTVDIRRLTLAGLHVDVTQDGEHFNFSSMLDHFKSDEEKEKDTTPSEWVIRLGDLRLSHARASYNDLGRNKQWRIADMNLRVPGFVIGGKDATQAGLNLSLEDGGRLNVNTHYDAASNDYSADITLADFALSNVKEYIGERAEEVEMEGTLDARIKATGNLSEVMQSSFSGDVEVNGVNMIDAEEQPVVAMQSLKVDIGKVNIDANRFNIAAITLEGLEVNYEQWPDGTNFSRLLAKKSDTVAQEPVAEEPDTVAPSAPRPKMQLTVGSLAVSGCALTYVDHTLPDEFRFPVTNISVDAQNITTSGNNNARVRASLPGGGILAVRWQGDISDWTRHQDLILSLKGMDLSQLSPMAVAYTGYPIEDGILGITSRTTVTDGALDGKNTIDIYKVTVSKKRKDVKPKQKIPLRAALYVLKDKDDKIMIDMPVKGNVKDPEFNYMKLVWKTLGNLLVKVATSPVRAIGNAMGMGDGDLDFMAISPEQHGLTSEQYHTLADLAKVVNADSLVTLRMELHVADTDRAEMLNKHVHRYLVEQGVDESRLEILTGDAPVNGEPSGYNITSELKIDE